MKKTVDSKPKPLTTRASAPTQAPARGTKSKRPSGPSKRHATPSGTASVKFTTDLRERFLTLLERGDSIEDACADVGISRATVTKWAAKGRRPDAPDDGSAEFAFRLDEIKEGLQGNGLAKDDLVRLLEKQARHGSVRAIQLLLERPWEKTSDGGKDDEEPEGESDPFAADPADELKVRRAQRGGAAG